MQPNRFSPRTGLFCGVSIALISLSGCVESTGSSGGASGGTAQATASAPSVSVSRGKTAEERKLEREVQNLNQITRDIIVSNTVQGVVVGALAGCALSRLAGKDCADGAVAGGIAGGIYGNQVGRQAAQKKRELVAADQTLAKPRGIRQKLSGVESNLMAVLRKQDSEIASLRRQVSAGQVSASAAKSRISSINDNRRTVSNGLAKSEANVASEKAKLVNLERGSGENYATTKAAVDSTSSRIRSLRNTVKLVSS